ncbi:hypothetical protein ACP70R_031578 [Stipagrostis hirtigluma subsp. patula]
MPRRAREAVAAAGDDDGGDTLSVEYRFSPGKVFRVVAQLSEEQRELVRSTGFGGLLHLPLYDKLDRHFSAWLFTKVAAAPPSVEDGAGAKVPVTARDVHDVLGVPHGARPVGAGATERDVAAVLQALFPGGRPDQEPRRKKLTLADAWKVLQELTAPPPPPSSSLTSRPTMAPPERDAFVVAFVIYAVGHFLAPLGLSEHTNTDVFHALVNPSPSEVRQYDWAGYVLRQLLDCAGRVRKVVKPGSSKTKIELSGCLLFLQVFYLDRIDPERPQPGRRPRIAAYDAETLRTRIERDRYPVWREGGLKQFGMLKFVDEPPMRPDTPMDASGSSSSTRGPQLDPNSEFIMTKDPQEHLMSPASNSTGTKDRPNSEFGGSKDPQEQLISPEAPTDASGTTTRGPRHSLNSASDHREDSDTDEDEEYEIYKSYYLMRKCRKERKRSRMDQVAQHLPLDEQGRRESYGRERNPTLTPKGLADSNEFHPSSCGANTDATAVRAANSPDGSGECFSTGNNPGTAVFAPADRVLHAQGGSNLEDIFIARKPRTQLAPIRKSKFHIEEMNQQGSQHHVMQADSPSAVRHQVVQTTCGQTNSHPSGHDVIDIDPDQPDKRHVASEAEQEPGNKRQRVKPDSSQKDANACFRWLKSCRKDDDQLKWAWIVHNEPTPIEVTGESIRSQFICGGSLKPDICNLMMRLFCELDNKMYLNSEERPRHFLAAEWATLALRHGSNLITESSPALRPMFTGPHIIYKVECCRMGDSNSGMYMLHFAREFDGTKVKEVPKIEELRRDLLYELLTMGSNTGRLPPALPIHKQN